MNEIEVWTRRGYITTVFYDEDVLLDAVRDGLVNHDGYPTDIQLRIVEKPSFRRSFLHNL